VALDDRQRRFCLELVAGASGAEAARAAGYGKAGARNQATRLLAKDDIRAFIATLRQQGEEAAGIDRASALSLLWKMAQSTDEKGPTKVAALRLAGEWLGWAEPAAVKDDKEGGVTLVPQDNSDQWAEECGNG
jgi:hypothetical protein